MSLDIVSLFIRADNFTASAVCCRLMSSTLGSASSWAEIRSIVPLGRGYFSHNPRHFVPGYYQPVPPGQKPFGPRAPRLKLTRMGACPYRRQAPSRLLESLASSAVCLLSSVFRLKLLDKSAFSPNVLPPCAIGVSPGRGKPNYV